MSFVLLSLIALQLLIISPFISTDCTTNLINVIFNSVDKYPKISMNAINMWNWFFSGNLIELFDNVLWHSISYKTWVLLLFVITFIAALLPLFLICVSNVFHKSREAIKKY